MATSGTIRNDFRTGYAVQLVWNVTGQSIANNTSTVRVRVQLVSTGSSYNINSTAIKNGSVTINGTTYKFTFTAQLSGSQTKTLDDRTVTISHGSDGKKTCSFGFSVGLEVTLSGKYWGTIPKTGTGTFDTIPRATVFDSVSAGSSYINSTITYKYTPKASSFYNRLVVKVGGSTLTTVNLGTKATSQQTGTLTLSSSQLNTVYSKYPKAVSAILAFTVETYSDSGYSSKVGTSTERKLTLTFPTSLVPTISNVALSDPVSGITTKFGTYVQNKSKVRVVTTASGVSGSTISSVKVTINGVTYTGTSITSGLLTKSGNISISIKATDSRGRVASASRTISVTSYSPPKINAFTGFRAKSDGTEDYNGTYVKMGVNFSISSVGDKNDKSYTIEYKLKSASSWTSIASGSVYSLSSNPISGSVFSVDHAYDVRLRVSDYFGSDSKIIDIPTAFTLLDLRSTGKGIAFGKVSEKDAFEVALPAFFNAPITIGGEDKILWSGGWYMTEGHTATLKQKVSEQQSGIVIVFSRYADGASQDYGFNSFFIPKEFVTKHNGGGSSFLLNSNPSLGIIGAKYLYISDDKIVGHAENKNTGTASSGITYNNSAFVLRYVIGV